MIRQANELDIPRLAVLAQAYSEEAKNHSNFPYDADYAVANVATAMLSDCNCLLVAVSSGQVVGFIWAMMTSLPWSRSPIVFDNIFYVSPEHRGTFIACHLLKKYERWAKNKGAVECCLSLASGITEDRTGRFYEAMGYRRIGSNFRKEL